MFRVTYDPRADAATEGRVRDAFAGADVVEVSYASGPPPLTQIILQMDTDAEERALTPVRLSGVTVTQEAERKVYR